MRVRVRVRVRVRLMHDARKGANVNMTLMYMLYGR